MRYTERYDDQERGQVYAELVQSCMGNYPCAEGILIAELLDRQRPERQEEKPVTSQFSWLRFLRLPFFGRPSLT